LNKEGQRIRGKKEKSRSFGHREDEEKEKQVKNRVKRERKES